MPSLAPYRGMKRKNPLNGGKTSDKASLMRYIANVYGNSPDASPEGRKRLQDLVESGKVKSVDELQDETEKQYERDEKKESEAKDVQEVVTDLYKKGYSDAAIALKLNMKISDVEVITGYLQAKGVNGGTGMK